MQVTWNETVAGINVEHRGELVGVTHTWLVVALDDGTFAHVRTDCPTLRHNRFPDLRTMAHRAEIKEGRAAEIILEQIGGFTVAHVQPERA